MGKLGRHVGKNTQRGQSGLLVRWAKALFPNIHRDSRPALMSRVLDVNAGHPKADPYSPIELVLISQFKPSICRFQLVMGVGLFIGILFLLSFEPYSFIHQLLFWWGALLFPQDLDGFEAAVVLCPAYIWVFTLYLPIIFILGFRAVTSPARVMREMTSSRMIPRYQRQVETVPGRELPITVASFRFRIADQGRLPTRSEQRWMLKNLSRRGD